MRTCFLYGIFLTILKTIRVRTSRLEYERTLVDKVLLFVSMYFVIHARTRTFSTFACCNVCMRYRAQNFCRCTSFYTTRLKRKAPSVMPCNLVDTSSLASIYRVTIGARKQTVTTAGVKNHEVRW
jgi:hypothetical protein